MLSGDEGVGIERFDDVSLQRCVGVLGEPAHGEVGGVDDKRCLGLRPGRRVQEGGPRAVEVLADLGAIALAPTVTVDEQHGLQVFVCEPADVGDHAGPVEGFTAISDLRTNQYVAYTATTPPFFLPMAATRSRNETAISWL